MALPAGVSTATLIVGVPVNFSGAPLKSYISIKPSVSLVHIATGTPLVNLIDRLETTEGAAGQFALPHTDQDGFQDENGNAYKNWYYTATIQYAGTRETLPETSKTFQLLVGQSTVDLDLLPSGVPAMPYSGPVAGVTSVNGQTGAVEVPATTDSEVATFVSALGPTQAAIEELVFPVAPGVPQPTDPLAIPVLRTVGDGKVAVWEYIQNGGGGYLWHLLQGAASTSGDWLFGMGIDSGFGNGILIRNKSKGIGQKIEQTSQITSATAYGLTVSQDSIAPGMYLELRPTGQAPLFVMQSFQTDQNLKMLTLASAQGSVMNVNGYSGLTSWDKDSEYVGGTLTVRHNNGVPAPARKYIKTEAVTGMTWHSPSGTDNQWWPFRINTGGSTFNIQAAGLSGTPDSATFTSVIQVKNAALGFFGTSAIPKPAVTGAKESPAAAASQLAALTALGLTTDSTTVGVSTKTANYTLTANDGIIVSNGASLTLTLPDPTTAPVGRKLRIKNIHATAATVVSAGTSKTIDGLASHSIVQWEAQDYFSDGTAWYTLGSPGVLVSPNGTRFRVSVDDDGALTTTSL